MEGDAFVDVTDFELRALRRVRLFGKAVEVSGSKIPPSMIASSSQFGVTVVATQQGALISFSTRDVHCLEAKDSNRTVEVTDIPVKTCVLPGAETDELVSLACNSSGRVVSALVNTANGPFIHLFDLCAISPDYPSQAGVIQSVRVSIRGDARGIAMEWNPEMEGVFAAIASDGTLATYLFDIQTPGKLSIVGTTTLPVPGTCLSWSPKGKQLVVGDLSGRVLQYKPEMALVRTIPPFSDMPALQGKSMRCVGLCWLSTTEFMVAYCLEGRDEVDIALVVVKKGTAPAWTHFDDVTYSGGRSQFPQKVTFTPLHPWHIIFCASSKSTEVAMFGKMGTSWKLWQLEDTSRIETPVNHKDEETFPVGVCIDLSSQTPGYLSDDGVVQKPPCPTVMVISTDGVLHSFNAISSRAEHQSVNRAPLGLPQNIQPGVVPMRAIPSIKCADDKMSPQLPPPCTAPVPSTIQPPTQPHQGLFKPQPTSTGPPQQTQLPMSGMPQLAPQPQPNTLMTFTQPKPGGGGQTQAMPTQSSLFKTQPAARSAAQLGTVPEQVQAAPIQAAALPQQLSLLQKSPVLNAFTPPPPPNASASLIIPTAHTKVVSQGISGSLQALIRNNETSPTKAQSTPSMCANVSAASVEPPKEVDLVKLRTQFRDKVQRLDEAIFAVRERNDWLSDLKQSMDKANFGVFAHSLDESTDMNALMEDVHEMRMTCEGDVDELQCDMKELKTRMRQQQERIDMVKEHPKHSAAEHMLDFDTSYRQNKLDLAMHRLRSKVTKVDEWLDSTSSLSEINSPNKSVDMNMSAEMERKIMVTARNVSKAVVSRKNELQDIQRRVHDLQTRYPWLAKSNKESGDDASSILPTDASLSNVTNVMKHLEVTLPQADINGTSKGNMCTYEQKIKRLRAYALSRANAPCKVQTMAVKGGNSSRNKGSTSILSRIESKLNQSIQSPIRTPRKIMMDIGTQSPNFAKPQVPSVPETRPVQQPNAVQSSLNKPSNVSTSAAFSFNKVTNATNAQQPTQAVSSKSPNFAAFSLGSCALQSSATFTALSNAMPQTPKSVMPQTDPIASTPLLPAFKFNQPPAPATSPIVNVTTPSFGVLTGLTAPAKPQTPTYAQQTAKESVPSKPVASTVECVAVAPKDAPKSVLPVKTSQSTSTQMVSSNTQGGAAVPSTTITTTTTVTSTPVTIQSSSTPIEPAVPVSTVTTQSITTPVTTTSTTELPNTQTPQTTAPTQSTPATDGADAVSFTFKLPSTQQKEPTAPATAGVKQESVAPNNMDEGMMDEEGAAAVPSGLFSTSLGLGSTTSSTGGTAKSIFGGGMKLGSGSTPATSSLFGTGGSVFGGASNGGASAFQGGHKGVFGGFGSTTPQQQPQQSSASSFSFSSAITNTQQSTGASSAFGAKPMVGASSAFGGAPAFGSKPTFGAPSPLASSFGQATQPAPAAPQAGGFSAFAHGGASSGFGALAASQQGQKGSVFGGGGFGGATQQQQPQKSSLFGGSTFGGQTPSAQSSAFSTWR